jgi:Holliday junction DNA helicase RuvB
MNENLDPTTNGYNTDEFDIRKAATVSFLMILRVKIKCLRILKVLLTANQRNEALTIHYSRSSQVWEKTTLAIYCNELNVGIKITLDQF